MNTPDKNLLALAALIRNGVPLTLDNLRHREQERYIPASPSVLDSIEMANHIVDLVKRATRGLPVPPHDVALLPDLPDRGAYQPLVLAALIRGVIVSTPESRLAWLAERAQRPEAAALDAARATRAPHYAGPEQAGPSAQLEHTFEPGADGHMIYVQRWVAVEPAASAILSPENPWVRGAIVHARSCTFCSAASVTDGATYGLHEVRFSPECEVGRQTLRRMAKLQAPPEAEVEAKTPLLRAAQAVAQAAEWREGTDGEPDGYWVSSRAMEGLQAAAARRWRNAQAAGDPMRLGARRTFLGKAE